MTELREAYKVQDLARIDTASEQLTQAWSVASQEIYQATQSAGGNQGGPTNDQGPAEDNSGGQAQDVEFEEVK